MADDKLTSKPLLKELVEHAKTSKWYLLGLLLDLDSKRLNAIKEENSSLVDRLIAMYDLWLDTNPNATNNDVLKALERKSIEEITIANEFRKFLLQESIIQLYKYT